MSATPPSTDAPPSNLPPAAAVAHTLVGQVLKETLRVHPAPDDSKQAVAIAQLNQVYSQKLVNPRKPVAPKPASPSSSPCPVRRTSPRHSKNLRRRQVHQEARGELYPSTYLHVPRRHTPRRRKRHAVINTTVISSTHDGRVRPILALSASPIKTPRPLPEPITTTEDSPPPVASPPPASTESATGSTAGDMVRFRGFLRGITAIKRKAKVMRERDVHAKPALLLMGEGHLTLAPSSRQGKWNMQKEMTVSMWVFAPRTETLFAETSTNVRKHAGLETDEHGKFVRWLCCSRKDPSIFGWCPAWQGDMTAHVVQDKSELSAARKAAATYAAQHQVASTKSKGVGSRDQRVKEGIFAPRRTRPALLAAQDGRFSLHDTGGIGIGDGKMYGFSITAADGTVTTLANFSLPVDRWVAFHAVYDGFYLYIYVDGQEVAATRRNIDSVDGQLHPSDAPIQIGREFTGMISHVRIWNVARSQAEINASIRHRVSVKEVHSCGLPGHVSSSANASEVFVPNELTGKTAKVLLADIAFYDIDLYHGAHVNDKSIYSNNAQFHHCTHFGWRINPPMFFGAPRPYTHAKRSDAGHQFTTAAHNKHASGWDWHPLSSLTENVRSWGKVRICARWDRSLNYEKSGDPMEFCYKFLRLLAKQDFPQDWIFDVRMTSDAHPESLAPCTNDSPQTNTFFLAMVHLDQRYQRQERVLFQATSLDFEFPDCTSLLFALESQIRMFTTFWHTDVYTDITHTLRSRFAASKEEVDGGRSLRSILMRYLNKNLLYRALHSIQEVLPSRSILDEMAMSETKINQSLFAQAVWIMAIDMDLPALAGIALKLEIQYMHLRQKVNERKQRAYEEEQLAIKKMSMVSISARTSKVARGYLEKHNTLKQLKTAMAPPNIEEAASHASSMHSKTHHIGVGSTVPLYGNDMRASDHRATSFSLAFSWRTKLKDGDGKASLAALVNLDLACIAVDIAGVPLDSVHRFENHTQDHAVVAHGRQRDMRAAIHEAEEARGRWVSMAQTFDLDLNVASKAVHSFVFFMFGNYIDACSKLGVCTLRLQRHQHDASVVKMLVREGKRGGHPLSNTMAITTSTADIGTYSVDLSGLHAGMILCTMDRVENGNWILKTLRMPFPRSIHIVEQMAHMWPMLRRHTAARRPCINILYCSGCEKHQATTWHVPGAFEELFFTIAGAIKRVFPGIMVHGTPTETNIGAFKITFKRFKGASQQVLYSAMDNQGWLPTPALVRQLVTEAMGASVETDIAHEWPYNHDSGARCRLRITVYDGYYKVPVPGVRVSIHSIDSRGELDTSLAQVVAEKQGNSDLPDTLQRLESAENAVAEDERSVRRRSSSFQRKPRHTGMAGVVKLEHTHCSLQADLRGTCEALVNATNTYVCQFDAPGFYSRSHPPLRVGVAADDAKKKRRGLLSNVRESIRDMAIYLMPKIQTVWVALVDFDDGKAVRTPGILVTLTNMASGFVHEAVTNHNGFAIFHVPVGRYAESVVLPEWRLVQHTLSRDPGMIRFLETAKSFDSARRSQVDMHQRGIIVYGETYDCVRIPSIRWPHHFTVYDASTSLPMKGALVRIQNQATGEVIMSSTTNRIGSCYQMIPIGPELVLCITVKVQDQEYFSFQKRVPPIHNFDSPSLHCAFMCPIPPPGYGRAVLSWTHPIRQRLDLFVEHCTYVDDDATIPDGLHETVWFNKRQSDLAELTVPGNKESTAPISVLVKLQPFAEFRFHARQYGTFDKIMAKGTETKSLEMTDTEFRFYDEHGLVTTQEARKRLKPNVEQEEKFFSWDNCFVVRVESNDILNLDGNTFMSMDQDTKDTEGTKDDAGSVEEEVGISLNDKEMLSQIARSSALQLFRMIDPHFENESIALSMFVRAIQLDTKTQDYIAHRPELLSLFSMHTLSRAEIAAVDTDGDDRISVDELLAFATNLTLERIQDLFQLITPMNMGRIATTDFLLHAQSTDHVITFIHSTPVLHTLLDPGSYINELMELELDDDGTIDYTEMYDFMSTRAMGAGLKRSTTLRHKEQTRHLSAHIGQDIGHRVPFVEEMDTRQFIRSMFDQFKPGGHHDVVDSPSFVRGVQINVEVRAMLREHQYLRPLLYADDLEGLCKSIDMNDDGMITIDEVLYFARTLRKQQGAKRRMRVNAALGRKRQMDSAEQQRQEELLAEEKRQQEAELARLRAEEENRLEEKRRRQQAKAEEERLAVEAQRQLASEEEKALYALYAAAVERKLEEEEAAALASAISDGGGSRIESDGGLASSSGLDGSYDDEDVDAAEDAIAAVEKRLARERKIQELTLIEIEKKKQADRDAEAFHAQESGSEREELPSPDVTHLSTS